MTAFTLDSIPKRLTATTYQIAIITDLISVAGGAGDWDDHINLAVALCTQDKFQLRFVCTDNTSVDYGNPGRGVHGIYDAYESDLVGGTLPVSSLTRKQLQSITALGGVTQPPAAGYRVDGEADYWRVHTCSQRFIKMARDCGDPSGTYLTNPYGKIWVAINGGYGVFAQILKEAIVDGQLADILDRCVFFGCPYWNAYHNPNAWAYWCNNHYFVNSSTPGIFGATKMIEVYPIMAATMETNDAAQQAAWTTMKTQGAMGVYLESARAASGSGALQVPRAGESVVMQWWLLEAERLGSWSPTNTSNTAGGGFQLYDTNNWPYNTGGAGLWATTEWPAAETKFSPSHWGSPVALDTLAECTAAFGMSAYRTWLTTNFARYA